MPGPTFFFACRGIFPALRPKKGAGAQIWHSSLPQISVEPARMRRPLKRTPLLLVTLLASGVGAVPSGVAEYDNNLAPAARATMPGISHVFYLTMPTSTPSPRVLGLLDNLARHGFSPSQISQVDGFTLRQNISDVYSPLTTAAADVLSTLPTDVASRILASSHFLGPQSMCTHGDNYYGTYKRAIFTRSAAACSNVHGLTLGTLNMYMQAAKKMADSDELILFLQDDARLFDSFERDLPVVLTEVPLASWDVLSLHGGGTPPALQTPPEMHTWTAADIRAAGHYEPSITDFVLETNYHAHWGYGPHFGNAAQLMPAQSIKAVVDALILPTVLDHLWDGRQHIDVMQVVAHQKGKLRLLESTRCLAYPTDETPSSVDGEGVDLSGRHPTPPTTAYNASLCFHQEG